MNDISIDTVVIGGGHAGLSVSYVLQEENRPHIVLEKKRILEQWRSARWDSFMLNTPLRFSRLMGQQDGLPDATKKIPLSKTIELWESYVKERNTPYREGAEVISVTLDESNVFLVKVKTSENKTELYRAKNVIAAPGSFQIPRIPVLSKKIDPSIHQLNVKTYTNPHALREGAVLVVGSGQTGIQLTDELVKSGRKVFLATSKVPGSVRNYRGEDLFFWLERIGMLDLRTEFLADPTIRYNKNPITGNNHPISYHSLARNGCTILGGLDDISQDGITATFKDNLQENIAFAQNSYDALNEKFENWIKQSGRIAEFAPHHTEAEWEPFEPLLTGKTPKDLDLKENKVTTILWATGWEIDLTWLHIDAIRNEFGPTGRPESCETTIPGFYWIGFPWLRTLSSVNLGGFHEDALAIVSKMQARDKQQKA